VYLGEKSFCLSSFSKVSLYSLRSRESNFPPTRLISASIFSFLNEEGILSFLISDVVDISLETTGLMSSFYAQDWNMIVNNVAYKKPLIRLFLSVSLFT
jgi:hypothetical protein